MMLVVLVDTLGPQGCDKLRLGDPALVAFEHLAHGRPRIRGIGKCRGGRSTYRADQRKGRPNRHSHRFLPAETRPADTPGTRDRIFEGARSLTGSLSG